MKKQMTLSEALDQNPRIVIRDIVDIFGVD